MRDLQHTHPIEWEGCYNARGLTTPPSTVVLPFMVHLALFHMVRDLSRAAHVDAFPKMDAGSIWWVWAGWDGPSAKCPASAKGPA